MNLGELKKQTEKPQTPLPTPTESTHSQPYSNNNAADHSAPADEFFQEQTHTEESFKDIKAKTTRPKRRKWLRVVIVLVLMAALVAGYFIYKASKQLPLSATSALADKAPAKPDFAYFKLKSDSPIRNESGTPSYDTNTGVVSYKAIMPDNAVILVSQQKAPTNFTTDSNAFYATISKFGSLLKLSQDNAQAYVVLGTNSSTDGPTLGYYGNGLLVFGRSTKSLSKASWQSFIDGLELN